MNATRWKLKGIGDGEQLDVELHVDTAAPVVIEAIEVAAIAADIVLERDHEWDLRSMDRAELVHTAHQVGVADPAAHRNSDELIASVIEKRKEEAAS
jgi:hypothetical protein